MAWHDIRDRINDGCMRHPSDSPVWKTFDYQHKDFAAEPRNIILGLATDGMNPFKTLSVSHSTWPVVVVPYNLPPWMCMKQSNFIIVVSRFLFEDLLSKKPSLQARSFWRKIPRDE